MSSNKHLCCLAAGALVVCLASSAHAHVIQTTLDQSLSATPYVLSLGDDSAFALRSTEGELGTNTLSLSTRGAGQVAGSRVFGYEYIDKFAGGDSIGADTADFIMTSPAGTYADVPTTNDLATPYIGLSYLVDGVTHYAYAGFAQTVDGFRLDSYGVETEASEAIAAGATSSSGPVNDVPAPGGVLGALALAGLALIGWGGRRPAA